MYLIEIMRSFPTEYSEHIDENHNDVAVDEHGSSDVVIDGKPVTTIDDELCVAEEEEAVEADTQAANGGAEPLVPEDEGENEEPAQGHDEDENHSRHYSIHIFLPEAIPSYRKSDGHR